MYSAHPDVDFLHEQVNSSGEAYSKLMVVGLMEYEVH